MIKNVWVFLIGTPKFESRALGTRGKSENYNFFKKIV